jgi:membrane protein YqaA with SNARE-associated domain
MELLALFPIGFVGSVLWFVSAEAAAVAYGAQGWHPLAVGVCAALGQNTMHAILYFGGERLIRRWEWVRVQAAKVRQRFHRHLEEGYLTLTGIGALIGLPPLVGMVTLASGFGVPFVHALPVAVVGRIIRFTALAAVGEPLVAWYQELF